MSFGFIIYYDVMNRRHKSLEFPGTGRAISPRRLFRSDGMVVVVVVLLLLLHRSFIGLRWFVAIVSSLTITKPGDARFFGNVKYCARSIDGRPDHLDDFQTRIPCPRLSSIRITRFQIKSKRILSQNFQTLLLALTTHSKLDHFENNYLQAILK